MACLCFKLRNFITRHSLKTKIPEAKFLGETRINTCFILTFTVVYGRICSVLQVPGEHQNGGGCFPSNRGERNILLVSQWFGHTRGLTVINCHSTPSCRFATLRFRWREVVTMDITLVELLMILSLIIALAEYFNNRRDD